MIKLWRPVLNECYCSELQTGMIIEAFDYPENEIQELAVRYFQCRIFYDSDENELKKFIDGYPQLATTCDGVLEILEKEYDKVYAVRKINQKAMVSKNSPYMNETIENQGLHKFLNKTKIVKTNDTLLTANFIFHEFQKNEKYFHSRFVFLNALNLKKGDELIGEFQLATKRQLQITFVINCQQLNILNEINTELNDLIEKLIEKHIVILLSENDKFDCSHIKVYSDVNIVALCLSEDDEMYGIDS